MCISNVVDGVYGFADGAGCSKDHGVSGRSVYNVELTGIRAQRADVSNGC